MSVYRPQYKDKKTGKMKHTKIWYYEFVFAGRLIKESAKTASKTVAKEAEKQRRRELEKGFNGLSDSRDERVRSIDDLASSFLGDYKVRQPRSAIFAEHAMGHVNRLLGELMAVDITDRIFLKYQTDRLKEKAAPKTINEEVGFLLRLLPIAHAGAIRAQLKQQKRLKLKIDKRIGKAYSSEEKADLIKSAKAAPRSKAIYAATMLALHAGMRDKEIRTLQWDRLSLDSRIVTVGESKTDAGTGRTIPLNDDLFAALLDYTAWYTDRFGIAHDDWYVFPFGSGQASDEVIRDMAGHVSKDMLKHYSHIRTQAKRSAVNALNAKSCQAIRSPRSEALTPNSESVPQDPPQVATVN